MTSTRRSPAATRAVAAFTRSVDAYVAQAGLAAPEETLPAPPPSSVVAIRSLDLDGSGITSVIWATGFRRDFCGSACRCSTRRARPSTGAA